MPFLSIEGGKLFSKLSIAARQASSTLETALQRAESRGGWHKYASLDEEETPGGLPQMTATDLTAGATEVPRDGMAGAAPQIEQV